MKNTDKFDVIVIGAGPSGLACACTLAKEGVEVLVIERGEYPGAKNMFGGIFFSTFMEKLFPDFIEKAEWERYVSKRRFSMLTGDSEMAFEMKPEGYNKPPYNHSFISCRVKIDKWFAKRAEELGVHIICNYCVKDFLYEDGKVIGITSGGKEDSLLADVVVCAEGANSILAEKSGLRKPLEVKNRSIAVKEIIKFSEKTIEDRFGISGREGAAYEYFGSSVKGLLGNGFIYTNRDSLSVGVGFSMDDYSKKEVQENPNDILEAFKAHPAIKPLVQGGETVEYLAHMIPSDNYTNLPTLYRDGLLLVGDAAGFVNTSFFHEGVNLAMASGVLAGETIVEAKTKGDFSGDTLSLYKKKLDKSFIMQDLKNCRNFVPFLSKRKHIIDDYPALMNNVLEDYFCVSERSKARVKKDIFRKVWKNVKKIRAIRDLWGVFRNIV